MSVQAVVTFSPARLYNPSTGATIVAGTTGSIGGGARQNQATVDGDYRPLVGRIRLVIRTVTSRTYVFAFRNLDFNTASELESWAGSLLLFRDIYGRRIWGSFLDPQRVEYPTTNRCDVQVTYTQITYQDSV